MHVYINNKILLEDEPAINANCTGILYGYGLFETIKVKSKRMYFFYEHINRMKNSCPTIDINFNSEVDNIYKKCNRLIDINKLIDGSIRISLIKDANDNIMLIQTRTNVYKRELYSNGLSICISHIIKNPLSPLCRVKSMNYLENIISKNTAMANGFDEAVFINTQHHLTEGAVSNIFWIRDGKLHTPSIDCGLLAGITRNQVISITNKLKINCIEGMFYLEDLYTADEIFITNSLMGVMPVSRLSDKNYLIREDSITSIISEQYNKLTNST